MDLHGLGDQLPTADSTGTDRAETIDGNSQRSGARTRKRTKTGCLTCRKRRIKCGEERPICRNCVKSKRICEGYSQRVTFRDPSNWQSAADNADPTILYHNGGMPGTALPGERQRPPSPLNLSAATHPSSILHASSHISPEHGSTWTYDSEGGLVRWASTEGPLTPLAPPSAGPYTSTAPGGIPFYAQLTSRSLSSDYSNLDTYFNSHEYPTHRDNEHERSYIRRTSVHESPVEEIYTQDRQRQHPHGFVSAASAHRFAYTQPPTSYDQYQATHAQMTSPTDMFFSRQTAGVLAEPWARSGEPEIHNVWTEATTNYVSQSTADEQARRFFTMNGSIETIPPDPATDLQCEVSPRLSQDFSRPDDFLAAAAIQYQDDDYHDLESEDDVYPSVASGVQHDLGIVSQLQQQNWTDLTLRHYDAFVFQGVLDHYYADFQASPLKNELTARVFLHFISATGPSLGIFERNPRASHTMFADTTQPSPQHTLWTRSIPMLALNDRGLLHAMLALSSLQIANLQGASTTPSIKHYMFALKSVHRAVGSEKKRHYVTTLAATLLLGYYEVMTADHAKWCSHLSGARQLLLELDFPSMIKSAVHMNDTTRIDDGTVDYGIESSESSYRSTLDEHLTTTLFGRSSRHDQDGGADRGTGGLSKLCRQSTPAHRADGEGRHVPPLLDLELVQVYQDLWWWFARQDAYQSIVSGNRLLMDFRRWGDCPPRARIGREDATYGTHDHIILLLARIADFSAKDRTRKMAVIETRNGQWRPPVGGEFKGLGKLGPPPAGSKPRRSPPRQPDFMGMAPQASKAYMPSSYGRGTVLDAWPEPSRTDPAPAGSASAPDEDTQGDLAATIKEWLTIRSALETLGSNLGPSFQPMDTMYAGTGPIESPFGTTIDFQKFDIAVLNAMYHMLRIIHYRAHPDMPPASMVAAGVAAPFTGEFVTKIGKIAAGMFALAGLIPNRSMTFQPRPLNPSIGGILCEVSMPLFFAGVQFQDAAQRAWLVDHLRELEIRTGFATAGMIGHGCETAWKRAGEAGAGAPYQRSGHWARRDAVADQGDSAPRAAWAQGVRGFENENTPALGLGIGEMSANADRGAAPTWQRPSQAHESPDNLGVTSTSAREADMVHQMHVFGDSKMEMHWAMGLAADGTATR